MLKRRKPLNASYIGIACCPDCKVIHFSMYDDDDNEVAEVSMDDADEVEEMADEILTQVKQLRDFKTIN
jgi:hypothetical protein